MLLLMTFCLCHCSNSRTQEERGERTYYVFSRKKGTNARLLFCIVCAFFSRKARKQRFFVRKALVLLILFSQKLLSTHRQLFCSLPSFFGRRWQALPFTSHAIHCTSLSSASSKNGAPKLKFPASNNHHISRQN
jgi:hypothetical protein